MLGQDFPQPGRVAIIDGEGSVGCVPYTRMAISRITSKLMNHIHTASKVVDT